MTTSRPTPLPADLASIAFARSENAKGEPIWVYEGTRIQVPGARDVTLADRVRPLELGRPDEPPQAIIVSLEEIKRDDGLNWVLQRGEHLTTESGRQLFSVPWPVWHEHSTTPVDVYAPEQDEPSAERSMALAERDMRFARAALDDATQDRLRKIALCTELGMTRRELATLVGVSPGRVQQLLDEVSDELREDVLALLRDAVALGSALPSGPLERDAVPLPRGWTPPQVAETLDKLIDCGLLGQDRDTHVVWPTRSLAKLLARTASGGS